MKTSGHLRERGANSWEIKFELPRPPGAPRRTQRQTVHGTRKDAQRALRAALAQLDTGTWEPPSRLTLAVWLASWIVEAGGLSPKTRERYAGLIRWQITPHLGAIRLQQLRPVEIAGWHALLLARGGAAGGRLAPRTVGHCHRVLRVALQRAVELEVLPRNVAAAIHPPSVPERELAILDREAMTALLSRLASDERARRIYPIAALAVASGLRRGELLALAWRHIEIAAGIVTVERSLEETAGRTLRFKPPKTAKGRRKLTIPRHTVEILLQHRRWVNEWRLVMGEGGAGPDDLLFAAPDGTPPSPDNLSRDWRRLLRALGLPPIGFHALRHTHASLLIHAGLDVMAISRRLGHANAAFTLRAYGHLFAPGDAAAAAAVDRALGFREFS